MIHNHNSEHKYGFLTKARCRDGKNFDHMKISSAPWNRFRYTLYAPFYDFFAGIYKNSRKKSIESLEIKPGDKVLIVGAGTGLDLEYLPVGCKIFATDITPAMLKRSVARNRKLNLDVQAVVMDGQALGFADNSMDKVILHLILAVIPDPIACIKETERVLKPGGKVAVYDKFAQKGMKCLWFLRFVNVFSNFLITDLTRDFETMLSSTNLKVVSDQAADFKGFFRRIKLVKSSGLSVSKSL